MLQGPLQQREHPIGLQVLRLDTTHSTMPHIRWRVLMCQVAVLGSIIQMKVCIGFLIFFPLNYTNCAVLGSAKSQQEMQKECQGLILSGFSMSFFSIFWAIDLS